MQGRNYIALNPNSLDPDNNHLPRSQAPSIQRNGKHCRNINEDHIRAGLDSMNAILTAHKTKMGTKRQLHRLNGGVEALNLEVVPKLTAEPPGQPITATVQMRLLVLLQIRLARTCRDDHAL